MVQQDVAEAGSHPPNNKKRGMIRDDQEAWRAAGGCDGDGWVFSFCHLLFRVNSFEEKKNVRLGRGILLPKIPIDRVALGP